MPSSRQDTFCLKSHALARWVHRWLGQTDHERRVAAIATTLFDLTSRLHDLNTSDRQLLRWAAIVHDVGRAIDRHNHPRIGAAMIREETRLPLTNSERRWLAYLTRHHKGRVPAFGADEILRRRDDHERLGVLLALLRAADALDSRSVETPELSFCLSGRRLRIACELTENSPKAQRVYSRRKKFRLLEELLDCRVEVIVSARKTLRRVA